MSGFTTCAPPPASAPDPSRRVNFTHGLVLGPRELTQESAYLANRAEEVAREAIGCGTVVGLAVAVERLTDGPALVVSPGLALSPRGRPIRVGMSQALLLNDWLNTRRIDLVHHLRPGPESPPGDLLRLFLTVGYRQCATGNEPAPSGPCRGDEPSDTYTRLADDFRLDLRPQPPDQYEDDVTREFAAWLRQIEIVEDGTATVSCDELLVMLRAAAALSSPPYGAFASPPEPIRIAGADACRCLRAAWLTWLTEIRPLGRSGASRPSTCAATAADEILIADVELPITVHHDGRWSVADASRIALRQDSRPFLVPLRLLQELALCSTARGGVTSVVAAGVLRGDMAPSAHRRPLLNGMRVTAVADGAVTVAFDGYILPATVDRHQYIVKAMSQPRPGGGAVIVNLDGYLAEGIRLRCADATGAAVAASELAGMEFSVEVSIVPA